MKKHEIIPIISLASQLIRNVHKQDAVLLRIPAFENAVAKVLKDIRIVRR